jgi:hypothetical protein
MHTEDLISDFESAAPAALRAAVTYQEKTMPFFPSFLSLYATGSSIPGSFKEEDYNDNQGYSNKEEEPRPSPTSSGTSYRGPPPSQQDEDEDTPPSPKAYNLTLLSSHAPSHLSTYNNDPDSGWGPMLNWPDQPSTPLSKIVPNKEP